MEEKNALDRAVEVSRLMADMMQHHERENKRLWCAVVALIVAVVIMAVCMVWAAFNAQRITDEAVLNALETVAEIQVVEETTTTTQTVEGDSATINNGDWEQFNDNAIKNGGDD